MTSTDDVQLNVPLIDLKTFQLICGALTVFATYNDAPTVSRSVEAGGGECPSSAISIMYLMWRNSR